MTSQWTQITALLRNGEPDEGLAARVADPLWMLARQRQFGALKGEDSASPVQLRIHYGSVVVDQMIDRDGRIHKIKAAQQPVEPLVEADDPILGPSSVRIRCEAALDFLNRCAVDIRDQLRPVLAKRFSFSEDINNDFVGILASRSFDAAKFVKISEQLFGELMDRAKLPKTSAQQAWQVFKIWRTCQQDRFVKPAKGKSQWNKARMEYGFALGASAIDAVLDFDSYDGSRFDWYQATLSSKSGKAFTANPKGSAAMPLLTRVRYSGMPSRRFWSFEDGQVFFGNLEADSTDLPQLILTEFATAYSDDWYYAPVTLPTGSLGRVTKVEMIDSFGDSRVVPPAAVADGNNRSWRFFELSGDKSADAKNANSPWLYVPRVTDSSLNGPEIERVTFVRDEAANLMWAIESKIEGIDGKPKDRGAYWHNIRTKFQKNLDADGKESVPDKKNKTTAEKSGNGTSKKDHGKAEEEWRYILETTVPPYWIPFTPQISGKAPNGMLERRRMVQWQNIPDELLNAVGPRGLITAPEDRLTVHDEEIPRGGLIVSRAWQAARGSDGELLLWPARRKRPAGQVETSGREVDMATDGDGKPVDDKMAGDLMRRQGK